jgi:hypothetical protein
MRVVAREFGVSLQTVQKWVARAEGRRLDRVDWTERPRGGRRSASSTPDRIENLVLRLRQQLRESSHLGEYGAAAIHRRLKDRRRRDRIKSIPSQRTIGRILERRGALDGGRRVRRPAPPKGWHLPLLADRRAELDSFDFVEGLVIRGGIDVEVFNAVSLHGGLCASFVGSLWTAKNTAKSLSEHWRNHGLPQYAQFDNDTRFQGAHQHKDSFGQVTRLCLQLGITPVFAPPRETGFQASIENYNGRWQAKVWNRFQHASLKALDLRSQKFIAAAHERSASRIQEAPPRRKFPADWKFNPHVPLVGTVIYLRRTNDRGEVHFLGRTFPVDRLWPHRLVRCEINLGKHRITFYRLRRREPLAQPKIKTLVYHPPKKPFEGDYH